MEQVLFGKTSYSNYLNLIDSGSGDHKEFMSKKPLVVTDEGHLFYNGIQYGGHVGGINSSRQLRIIPVDAYNDDGGDYECVPFVLGNLTAATGTSSASFTFKCLHIHSKNSADYGFNDFIKSDSTLPVSINIIFAGENSTNVSTYSFDKYRFIVTNVDSESDDMGNYFLNTVTVVDDVGEDTVTECYDRLWEYFNNAIGGQPIVLANGGLIGDPIEQHISDSNLLSAIKAHFPTIAIGSNVRTGFGGIAFGSSCAGEGYFGVALGRKSSSLNDYALAHGYRVHSAGSASFATGAYHQVTGKYSQAFGSSNVVSGEHSVAFNYGNTITGTRSAAFGLSNTVRANSAFACGSNLTVVRDKSFVIGEYNQTSSAARFIIGGGTAQTPKNLIDVNDNYANFRVQIAAEKLITCKAGLTVRSDTGADKATFQVPAEFISHVIIGSSSYGYAYDSIPELRDGQLYFVVEEN